MRATPIAVVGGGLAALVVAHLLQRAGHDVMVLGGSPSSGDLLRTERDGPWTWEAGSHLFSGIPREVLALFEDLGITRLTPDPVSDRRYLVHKGAVVPVPASTGEMMVTPLLSVAGRLRLLREPFLARGGHASETVAAFVRRRMGAEFSERFVEPVIAASTGGDPTALLARFAFGESVRFEQAAGSILKGRMHASRRARREGRRPVPPWSCREGVAAVPAQLATALGDAHRRGPAGTVVTLDHVGGGWRLRTGDGATHPARAVCLTTRPTLLAAAIDTGGGDASSARAVLAAVPHGSSATVALGYRRTQVAHPLDGHGMVAGEAGAAGFRSVVFDSTLFPDRAPADHVLLTVQVGGVHDPRTADLPDAELLRHATRAVAPLLGISGPPVMHGIGRWPEALPQAVAGHTAVCAAAEALEAAHPGLVLCGAWRDGLGESVVIRSALLAVERLRPILEA